MAAGSRGLRSRTYLRQPLASSSMHGIEFDLGFDEVDPRSCGPPESRSGEAGEAAFTSAVSAVAAVGVVDGHSDHISGAGRLSGP